MLEKSQPHLSEYEKPLTEVAEQSYTLPSYLYTDQNVYEVEKDRIFYRTWQFVTHTASLKKPGDYVTVQICDQSLFVMMGKDHGLRAFYNVCQHRAHELLPPGRGNVNALIVCPYHAWAFDREGLLHGAPRATQRPGFNKDDFSLKQARLEVFLDSVFINLDDEAVALSTLAADLEADVRARLPYFDKLRMPTEGALGDGHINAGWKVVVDNYVECYHCDHAHRDFANLICMDSYQHDTFGLWARQVGCDIRRENTAYELDDDAEVMHSVFWYLWPNTTINVMPGSEELNISAIRPTGLASCNFSGESLTTTGAFDQRRSDYTTDVLMPEDISLCESVQRGLKSKGYSQGPIITNQKRDGRGEHAIHHFHRMVQQALS